MNRQQLIKKMALDTGLTQVKCRQILRQLELSICQALHEGELVTLPKFGSFEIRYYLPRVGRDPNSGKAIEIPLRTVAAFKPSSTLKNMVNG